MFEERQWPNSGQTAARRSKSGLGADELLGQANGGLHAGGIGDALAGDVVGGAVVGRGPNEGKTERPIYARFEADHFKRGEPLVVIHGDDDFVIPFEDIVEERVGGVGAGDIEAAAARGVDGGGDGGDFLRAEFAAFAGMGIQSAHRDARLLEAEISARLGGEFDGKLDLGCGDVLRNEAQREMRGDEHDAQPAVAVVVAEKHHGGALAAGEFGEEFRLADKRLAGMDDGLLVDRRGDQRIEFLAETAFRAIAEPRHGGPRSERRTFDQVFGKRVGERVVNQKSIALARAGKWLERQTQAKSLVPAPEVIGFADQQVAEIIGVRLERKGLERDFGTDARDVAQRNAYAADHGRSPGNLRSRRISNGFKVAEEGFLLEPGNPLFAFLAAVLGHQRALDLVAEIAQRPVMRGTPVFELDDETGRRGFDDAAVLAGFELGERIHDGLVKDGYLLPAVFAAFAALGAIGVDAGHFLEGSAALDLGEDLRRALLRRAGIVGCRLVDHDHAGLDFVLYFEVFVVFVVKLLDAMRGDDGVRNVLAGHFGNDQILAHTASELFQREALRLEFLGELHAVGVTVVDLVLDVFVNDRIRDAEARDVKIVEDELPFDQKF